jgi:hypothetical protein
MNSSIFYQKIYLWLFLGSEEQGEGQARTLALQDVVGSFQTAHSVRSLLYCLFM